MELWARLGAAFFPPRCIFCGAVVNYKECCCPACAAAFPRAPEAWARPEVHAHLAGCVAPLLYRGAARERVLQFKEAAHKGYAVYFAALLEACLAQCGLNPERLTCVPNFEPAGKPVYNPPRVLARRLGERLGLPLESGLLQKCAAGRKQHLLSAQERLGNVRDLYGAAPGLQLAGETVLLLDDVVTTGATLDACAAALLAAGAGAVWGAAVAQTPAYAQKRAILVESSGEM